MPIRLFRSLQKDEFGVRRENSLEFKNLLVVVPLVVVPFVVGLFGGEHQHTGIGNRQKDMVVLAVRSDRV
jgi:hypothetical protein